jgi:cell volume regulation protein A
MDDVTRFGVVIAVLSLAGLCAVWSNRASQRIRIPAPALFLVAAAVASDLVPALGRVPILTVQRVVTVMPVLLLFDGGMHIGWRRFRAAAAPVVWIGVAGTAVTAAGITVLAHTVFGFDWRAALLLGVTLSPTDPAVVFSVLGRREITGRSGTLLEGESGANDPVGIAAMAAVLTAGTGGWPAVGAGLGTFAAQMAIGAAAGIIGGYVLALAMRRLPLPGAALYPLQTLLGASTIYGLATLAHGSGFLAVFAAGILVGDLRAPYTAEIERFHSSLASLAEIVAFTMLGLTVSVRGLAHGTGWLLGLGIAVLLAVLVRPVAVGLLLLPINMSRGERVFVAWSGLTAGAPADGCTIADLARDENTWISMINRSGRLVPLRGNTVLQAGDEVLLLSDPDGDIDPGPLFTTRRHQTKRGGHA